jgi:hypothetical protein
MTFNLDKIRNPEQFDIQLRPGVVLEVQPLTTLEAFEAEDRASKVLQELRDGLRDINELGLRVDAPNLENFATSAALSKMLLARELAYKVKGWRGVKGDSGDEDLPATVQNVTAALDNPKFARKYLDGILNYIPGEEGATVEKFLSDWCEASTGSERASDLYEAYCLWAEWIGSAPLGIVMFGKTVKKMPSIECSRNNKGIYYTGRSLNAVAVAMIQTMHNRIAVGDGREA